MAIGLYDTAEKSASGICNSRTSFFACCNAGLPDIGVLDSGMLHTARPGVIHEQPSLYSLKCIRIVFYLANNQEAKQSHHENDQI
jgi:hypothetical protein